MSCGNFKGSLSQKSFKCVSKFLPSVAFFADQQRIFWPNLRRELKNILSVNYFTLAELSSVAWDVIKNLSRLVFLALKIKYGEV